jgi:dTDP-4-dehydrorhamnose 3,5-epimerase
MFIPKGFAHGFCVLSDEADVVYKCSDSHAAGDEYGILWSDSEIGINWPINDMILADKDLHAPRLKDILMNYLPTA